MMQSKRQTRRGSRQTASCIQESPRPRKISQSHGRTGLQQIAAKVLRMTRRLMSDEEYAWIGSILGEYRASGRDRYLDLVRLAELDSGRIAACDLAYARWRSSEADRQE